MILKHVRGYVINQLKYKLIAYLCCLTITSLLAFYYYENHGQESKYHDDTKTLQSQIEDTKKKIVTSEYAIEKWNGKIKEYHSIRTGLRLDYIRKAIEQLRDQYKIRNLTINLSTPTLRKDITGSKYIDIEYSVVSMSFSTYTDIFAYKFLLALLAEFPGYAQVKTFTITGIENLTKDILDSIENGTAKDIVTVKVDIIWQDLSDKKEVREQLKKDEEALQQTK